MQSLRLDGNHGCVIHYFYLHIEFAQGRRVEPNGCGIVLLIDHPVDALTEAIAPFVRIGIAGQTHRLELGWQRVMAGSPCDNITGACYWRRQLCTGGPLVRAGLLRSICGGLNR